MASFADNTAIRLMLGTKVQNERVFRAPDYVLFTILTAVIAAVITYVGVHWVSLRDWQENPFLVVIPTLLLAYVTGLQLLRWFLLPMMRRPRPLTPAPGRKVAVATTFVPSSESIEMLEDTLRAIVAMDYEHETWVLDEGDDHEVKMVCQRLGVRHFSRKHRPEYQTDKGRFQSRTKHGNYNAWLHDGALDRYDYIVTFDPDHVPRQEFLNRILGFFRDPEVGYVQAPQVYYNQQASFIARGAAEETYAYYSSGQMGTYGVGHPIVTGCHNAHRASALREVGGFAPHDGDDLLITLMYRSVGWKGVYVPEVLALGLTPVDWTAYLHQQLRWARSVLDIKFRLYPHYAGKLVWRERILSLLHGLFYLQGLCVAVGLVLFLVLMVTGLSVEFLQLRTVAISLLIPLIFIVTDLFRQRFYLDWKREWGLHWRSGVLQVAKWPFILRACVDAIFAFEKPYSVTPKKSSARTRTLTRAYFAVLLLIGACWGIGMLRFDGLQPMLHIWAAISLCFALALIWTERWLYPAPFDRRLLALFVPEPPPSEENAGRKR